MLGGSLHSALTGITNRTRRKPPNFDDFGMLSPSSVTQERCGISLRRRFQRGDAVAAGGMSRSEHQSFASQRIGHSNLRRHRRRSLRGHRHRRLDLRVHPGADGGNKESDDEDDRSDDSSDSVGGSDEDEEYGSPALSAPVPLAGSCGRPRKGSKDQSWGCGHNTGCQSQELVTSFAARQRRMIQIMLIVLIGCGLYLCYDQHNQLVRHESLASHFSEREAVVQRLHRIQHGIQSDVDRHNDVPGGQSIGRKIVSKDEADIGKLSHRVESLQGTMQQMARQLLVDNFPSAFAGDKEIGPASSPFVDVKLDLNGLQSSLVIQVAGSKMPYTTWKFLRQLRDVECWALQGNNQWFEIIPLTSASEDTDTAGDEGTEIAYVDNTATDKSAHHVPIRASTYHQLDFLEDSAVEVDRSFVVGMRNPKEGDGGGFPIVSIYPERGMCGCYEDEVCFGRIVDGFESLNLMKEMVDKEAVAIDNVLVLRGDSSRDSF
jgi:hypothetical protein